MIAGAVCVFLVLLVGAQAVFTYADLWRNSVAAVSDWRTMNTRLSTPGAGFEVLRRESRIAIALLHESGAQTYRIAENLRSDMEIIQRTEEGAWPLQYDGDAEFLVSQDVAIPDCDQIDARQGIALDRCH
jgi:hypothetical protein